MKISVKIKNLPKIRRALASSPRVFARRFDRAIKKSIFLIESRAKPRTPVDTGRLRGSYRTAFRPLYGSLTPMVNYAIFVHFGTRYMTGRPFLQEGIDASESTINKVFQKELQDGLNEIARRGR